LKLVQQYQEIAKIFNEGYSLGIFHHWDTDGIASAALILKKYKDQIAAMMTPRIGFYSEEAINIMSVPRDVDYVIFLDYGINGEDYERIHGKLNKPLIVIDHHLAEPWCNSGDSIYCNPVALGVGDEAEYPSTTYLLSKILGVKDEHDVMLIALGIIGDLAPYFDAGISHRGLEYFRKLVINTKVDMITLRRAADILDSCYRIYNGVCIEHVVRKLAFENIEAIMGDAYLFKTYNLSKEIMLKALKNLDKVFSNVKISVYYLCMDAYVTSYVGRKLAKDNPDKIIVLVHEIPRIGGGFIYIRSIKRTLKSLIKNLRKEGFKVGGKEKVAVIEFMGSYKDTLRRVIDELEVDA